MSGQADPFWLVWSPTGSNPPQYRHPSEEGAEQEAERLARAHPGSEFIVLQSVSSRLVESMRCLDLRPKADLPF
jgi:hypothetical protein